MSRKRILTGLALALCSSVLSAGAAQAQTPTDLIPKTCDNDPIWEFNNKTKDVYIHGSHRAYGDAGVKVEITAGESTTWTGSVTGGLSSEVGAVFAKASASFSVTVSVSRQTSVTKSGSWTVPASAKKGGYLEAGASGISFNYKKTYWVSPCKKKSVSGLAKGVIPTSSVWFSKHVV